jgi:hypothetical protein
MREGDIRGGTPLLARNATGMLAKPGSLYTSRLIVVYLDRLQ